MPPSVSGRCRSFALLLLVALGPALYAASILVFAVNVPVGDDYDVLGFVNEFRAADGFEHQLRLLFSFHNEHRIVVTRIVMLLSATVQGALDFRVPIVVGNLAFMLALVVIGRMLRFRGDAIKWALLFLLTLHPQPLRLMFYPMAGVTAYCGVLFSLLYLYFWADDSRLWPVALWCYVLTVLTIGSGIFLAVIGIPIALLKGRYARAALQAALTGVVVLWYAPQPSDLSYVIEHPLTVARFFLLLLGSIAQLPAFGRAALQMACSIVLLGHLGFLVCEGWRRRADQVAPERFAMLCCLGYLLMVIGLIAVGRASAYANDVWAASLDGRYRMYSMLFAALCVIDGAGRLAQRGRIAAPLVTGLLAVSLAFNVAWFVPSWTTMRRDAAGRTAAMKHWRDTRDASALPVWSTPRRQAEANLSTAVATGSYRP